MILPLPATQPFFKTGSAAARHGENGVVVDGKLADLLVILSPFVIGIGALKILHTADANVGKVNINKL